MYRYLFVDICLYLNVIGALIAIENHFCASSYIDEVYIIL